MHFNEHFALKDKHAFLSASKYSWLNYTDEKLVNSYINALASAKGTALHKYAADSIALGIKLPNTKKTLNMYVNDAIGFKMQPEKILFYSENCFGTADTISFRNGLLRIHDLKTGIGKVSMNQLYIYIALFCLEYKIKPLDIQMETRIYQMDDIIIAKPTVDIIVPIIDKIITFDKLLTRTKLEEV